MYIPKHFEETRIDVMHELIRSNPLATLVTLTADGITANHIPIVLTAGEQPYGVLQGHVARSNRLWNDFLPEMETLAIFQGPDAYISPSWYASKQETGKVVPTWNYAVVHAYGTLRIIDDPLWIRQQVESLTHSQESVFQAPWAVSDAPDDFIQKLIGSIVGFEIVITRLLGKWKVSQNQPPGNRAGVISGLHDHNFSSSLGMADLIPPMDNENN